MQSNFTEKLLGFIVVALVINIAIVLTIMTETTDVEPPIVNNIYNVTINIEHTHVTQKEIRPDIKPRKEPVKPKDIALHEDIRLLSHIINAEARNQPYDGKIAVGNVVLNRVNHPQFPDTIKDVIYQKGQFQPVTNGAINKKPDEDSIKAAKEVLNGRKVVDSGVLYFYNPSISTSDWIFTRRVATKIGDHAFAF